MAEIIVEPSALSKIIPISFKINDTDSITTTRLATKKQFNTTDTDAWLSFTLDGIDANMTGYFDLTMVNVDENPSSIINRTNLPFSAIPFHYKIDASADVEKNQIRHAGRWIGQVILRLANGDTTTRQFDFAIVGHLLDGKEARLILIEDYNALMATITTSKDELAQYNIDYAALIETVTTQEAARVQAELTRAQTFDALVESEMIAQNVATKLTEKEATYAPRLLSAEQQLAQKANQTALEVEKVRIDNLSTLTTGSTTGDAELIDGHVGADAITYPNIGGAIRGQVGNLKADLNIITDSGSIAVTNNNAFVNLTGTTVVIENRKPKTTAGTGVNCAIVACSVGDKFTIYATVDSEKRIWGFVDVAGTITNCAAALSTASGLVITAPTNSAWLIINDTSGSTSYFGELIPSQFDVVNGRIVELGYTEVNPTITSGRYFNTVTGLLADGIDYSMTAPFLLKKGETIKAICRGAATAVGIICSADDVNWANPILLVPSIDGEEREYTYTATTDIYIFVTYRSKKTTTTIYPCHIYTFISAKKAIENLATKQDTLIAGNNITIDVDGKTINAVGGSDTIAINGIDLYTNLVKNPSFDNGLTDWVGSPLINISVTDGILSINTANSVLIKQNLVIPATHKIYLAINAWHNGTATSLNIYAQKSGGNEFLFPITLTAEKTRYAYVLPITTDTMTIVMGRNGAGGIAKIDDVTIIDLTAEPVSVADPTLEDCIATFDAVNQVPIDQYIADKIANMDNIQEAQLSESVQMKLNADVVQGDGKWTGAKLGCLGDSITATDASLKKYFQYMTEYYPLSGVSNAGISGSTISDTSYPMHSRVNTLDVDCNIVTVLGGTNDFQHGVALGELYTLDGTKKVATTNTATFYGALHTMCQNLIAAFPTKTIILMTPMHRGTFGAYPNDTEQNSAGKYLIDYVDAIIKIGEWYSIPVLDLYRNVGFNPNVPAQASVYFGADQLHPNTAGHSVMADKIEGILNTL